MKQFGNNAVFKRILFRPEPMMIPAGTGTFLNPAGIPVHPYTGVQK